MRLGFCSIALAILIQQRARPKGYRSQVDGHNRSLVDHQADSTLDWSEEQMWEEEEEER